MSTIKIFVSCRIDLKSEPIDNPLYVPVRCGAVFDADNDRRIIGDDTGDNISIKRTSFCEFTVQYWAWKNAEADYYGLCHYRRFLSFSDKKYRTNLHNMAQCLMITAHNKKKFLLENDRHMREVIEKHDLVLSEYAEVTRIPTPLGNKSNVLQMWHGLDNVFFPSSAIDIMFELIEKLAPQYLNSAKEYFNGHLHRGFNCYIMKRELFFRLCEFQFPILFEFEKLAKDDKFPRTIGYVGEMLYGIFTYHITTYETHRVKTVQLAYFEDAGVITGKLYAIKKYLRYGTDKALRFIVAPILPLHSRRREFVKRIVKRFIPNKKCN